MAIDLEGVRLHNAIGVMLPTPNSRDGLDQTSYNYVSGKSFALYLLYADN